MTKPNPTLTELLDAVCDVEEKAETWTDKHKGCFATNASNRYEGFKAGAHAVAGPLRQALEYTIEVITQGQGEDALLNPLQRSRINDIRSILSKASEGEAGE